MHIPSQLTFPGQPRISMWEQPTRYRGRQVFEDNLIDGKDEENFVDMGRQRVQVESVTQRSNESLEDRYGWEEWIEHGV